MKYDLIIFDLDGTLLDSLAHVVRCVHVAAEQLGLICPSDQFIRDGVGIPLAEQVTRLFPDINLTMQEQVLRRFQDCYYSGMQQYVLYDGVEEVLQQLKSQGLFLGLATNMGRTGMNNVLQQTPLGELIDIAKCASDTQPKPSGAMVEEIMAFCDIDSNKTLMVGDTIYDIQTANNAGVDAIAVSYGAHDVNTLKALEPLAVINHLNELKHTI